MSDKATFCPNCGFPIKETIDADIIYCPECKHQVSKKDSSCLNCGYPLVPFFYITILYIPSEEKIPLIRIIMELTGLGLADSKKNIENLPYQIKKSIDSKTLTELQTIFDKMKIKYTLEKSSENIAAIKDNSIDNIVQYVNERELKIKCPTCGSTRVEKISTTSKIAGAVTLGILSKTARSQFKCKHCGYKW